MVRERSGVRKLGIFSRMRYTLSDYFGFRQGIIYVLIGGIVAGLVGCGKVSGDKGKHPKREQESALVATPNNIGGLEGVVGDAGDNGTGKGSGNGDNDRDPNYETLRQYCEDNKVEFGDRGFDEFYGSLDEWQRGQVLDYTRRNGLDEETREFFEEYGGHEQLWYEIPKIVEKYPWLENFEKGLRRYMDRVRENPGIDGPVMHDYKVHEGEGIPDYKTFSDGAINFILNPEHKIVN